ncbi:MAG: hypothetical protein IT442_00820 [Phycisphaeraceae bacterium]|nr:hypothetical protein [Phycisphaeraceae bacterium]
MIWLGPGVLFYVIGYVMGHHTQFYFQHLDMMNWLTWGLIVTVVAMVFGVIILGPWLSSSNRRAIRNVSERRRQLRVLVMLAWVPLILVALYPVSTLLLMAMDRWAGLYESISLRDWVHVAVGIVLSALAFLFCRWFALQVTRRFLHSLHHRGDCDRCGYPLQASGSLVCPECGAIAPRPPWRDLHKRLATGVTT